MDRSDLDDLRLEMVTDEASRDTPINRTRQQLLDAVARVNQALDALDDVDDLQARACELAERTRREIVDLMQAAVRFDRARGATWEEVGASLSVTRQAAWERFGP
jgi:hypothetical protein